MIIKNKKIKIISGYLKGRNINIIQNQKLRPTMHRIRETLFNWLKIKIINAECLDCFAGSGALSIEAISRYAKNVTLLEKNKKIINHLRKNIYHFNIQNITIINIDALKWLKKASYAYDIIFLDPPYYENILQKSIFLIKKYNLIKNKGYIYIEKHKNTYIIYPKHWILHKKKKTKKIEYEIYIYNKSDIK